MSSALCLLLVACAQAPDSPRLPAPAVAMMGELDQDGDGRLSAAEIPGDRGQELLPRLDTDHDGFISVEELRADLDATKPRQ